MIISVILGLAISYIVLFIISIILKDNSIADIFWGLGFLQVMIHSFFLSGKQFSSQILIFVLILIWSLRISFYIFSKKLLHKGEDPRYVGWRKTWKNFYLRSFLQVYLFQGILLLIIAIPLFLINLNPIPLSTFFFVGFFISIGGIIYETIGDIQLKRFIKNNPGTIMTKGLWKYSRHPNYFGEAVFWFGMMVSTIPISVVSTLSFLLISFLLRFVSGVPMAERRYSHDKEFQKYASKTPAMFPNFFIK